MAMLTDEQKKDYIAHWGCHCPHCGSNHITTETPLEDTGSGNFYQHTTCDNCGKGWSDIYDLVDIIEDEEESGNEEQPDDQAEVSDDLVEPLTPAQVSEDRKESLF